MEQPKPDGPTAATDGDRRSFLRKVAAVGGGVLAGVAGLGAGAEAQPPRPIPQPPPGGPPPGAGPRPGRGLKVRPRPGAGQGTPPGPGEGPGVAGQTERATGELTFPKGAPKITRGGSAAKLPSIDTSVANAKIPPPSGRNRLIQACSGEIDGSDLDHGPWVGEVPPYADLEALYSSTLLDMLKDDALAQAYAGGVLLTSTTCSSKVGGVDTLAYSTANADLCPFYLGGNVCRLTAMHAGEDQDVMRLSIRTPGASTQSLAYIVELCFSPDPTAKFDFRIGRGTVPTSPTSDGTLVALLQLSGSGNDYHSIYVYPASGQGNNSSAFSVFHWMNVFAV